MQFNSGNRPRGAGGNDAPTPLLGPPTPYERLQINRILRQAGYPLAPPPPVRVPDSPR